MSRAVPSRRDHLGGWDSDVATEPDDDDDRPPICPACGVTMGITVDDDGVTRFVCLECGFTDNPVSRSEF